MKLKILALLIVGLFLTMIISGCVAGPGQNVSTGEELPPGPPGSPTAPTGGTTGGEQPPAPPG
jgi:hypothetical protein